LDHAVRQGRAAAADQALILRRVTELSLTPGMNIMDGFLTTHLERTFYKHDPNSSANTSARRKTSLIARRKRSAFCLDPRGAGFRR